MASKRTTSKPTQAKKVMIRPDEELTSMDVQVKGVVSNISMLYNTIRELKERGDFQKIERLNVAQEENFAKLAALDETMAEKVIKKYKTNNKGQVASRSNQNNKDNELVERKIIDQTDEMLTLFNKTQGIVEEDEIYSKQEEIEKNIKVETFEKLEDIDEIYDVLSLPSNGQCYPHKKNKIAVSYLTATDENFITSPNLYRDGLITDCLLHRKIVDKTFDIDSLCSGDADAILYFLRVSSYGPDFPATFTDPATNETFETVIDLGQIKVKEFNLIGDENGLFEYELPVTKDKVKFRFLTKKDERKLERMNQYESNSTKALELRSVTQYIDGYIDEDSNMVDEDDKYVVKDTVSILQRLADEIEKKDGLPVNKLITNRLEMMVVSINGNSDREFVKKYVRNMVARDSLNLRKYILDNTPGLDFSIKIEKPESLGGGFIDTFLEWSDTVFLSIA